MDGRGHALRRMRLLRGIKQSHLADMLGVTQATVSRWERGVLPLPEERHAAARHLLSAPASATSSAWDVALKRLVESSTLRLHLICDRSHRLLAASRPRSAAWRIDPADLLGKPMLAYATAEILAAEAALDDLGWHDGACPSLTVDTGANLEPDVPILPGRVLWDRMTLADGMPVRLVTTIA